MVKNGFLVEVCPRTRADAVRDILALTGTVTLTGAERARRCGAP